MTAGEARARVARAGAAAGDRARPGRGRDAPERARAGVHDGRHLGGRRRVRAGQPPPAAGRDRPRRRRHRAGPARHRGRHRARSTGEPRTYPDDVAFVVWTSGTTGRPKPILHTHTAYLELLDRVLGPLRAAGGEGRADARKAPSPNLIPVSMALNAGIYNALFGLRAGAALVIMDRFEPGGLRRAGAAASRSAPPCCRRRPWPCSPTPTSPTSAPLKLRPLDHRAAVAAAGPALRGQVRRRVHPQQLRPGRDGRGHRLDRGRRQGPPREGRRRRPSAPGRRASGVDDDGHLLVRPPNAAVGIDERRDADGFIDTGDLARIDDDGFVWIEGRAGDLINRGGNKVYPEAVEEVLRLHPSVAEAVGRRRPRRPPRRGAGGVPRGRRRSTPSVLVAHCREHLVPYKVPADFRLDRRAAPQRGRQGAAPRARRDLRRRLSPFSSTVPCRRRQETATRTRVWSGAAALGEAGGEGVEGLLAGRWRRRARRGGGPGRARGDGSRIGGVARAW